MYVDQGYIVPRFNSTSAASLNIAAIQAALNAGGTVQIRGIGTVYINAPVISSSNTKLVLDPGIRLQLAPGSNCNLLQNRAYSSAFNAASAVTWDASHVQATVTWTAHGQSVGNYVWLQGQPSNGTTVTLNITSPGVVNWTAHGLVTGQQVVLTTTGALPTGLTAKQIYYVCSAGNTANAFELSTSYSNAFAGVAINFTGTQSGTHTAQTVPDSAYTGVFMVSAVTDANTIKVDLYRLPGAAPTGIFNIKQADQNITIEGGIWDYDYLNNTQSAVPPGGVAEHIASFAGIQNLVVRNMTGTNCPKFFFNTWALRDYRFENFGSTIGNSGYAAADVIHVYGPSFAGTIDRVYITPGIDDGVTLHPANPSFYSQFNAPGAFGGDILDVHISHVDFAEGSSGSVISYSVPGFLMDGITIEKIASRQNLAVVRLDQSSRAVGGNDPPGQGWMGTVKIKDIRWGETLNSDGISIIGQQNIDRLEIDGVMATYAGSTSSIRAVIKVDPSGAGGGPININQMIVRGLNINTNLASGDYYALLLPSGSTTITSLRFADSVLNGTGTAHGVYVLTTAVISQTWIENISAYKMGSLYSTSSPGAVTLTNNYLNGCFSGVADTAVGTLTARFGKNTITGGISGGLCRAAGVGVNVNIYSDGDNIGPTAGQWLTQFTSATASLKAEDFQVDVTAVSRTDGGKLYNTNAAAGTLGSAGLVDGLGTAAGSWHLRGTPTLVY